MAIANLRIEEVKRNMGQNERSDILQEDLKNSYKEQKKKTTVNASGNGFLINHRGYQFEVDDNYQISCKEPFEAEEWDKTACKESSFLWESDDPNSGEAYHTIVGFTEGIGNEVKLKIPSRCHVIIDQYRRVDNHARDLARKFYTAELPDSLEVIGYAAFASFEITNITIPSSVVEIDEYAFADCTNLLTININSGIKSVGKRAFDNTAWLENQPDGEVYIGKVLYGYKGIMPENYNLNIKDDTEVIADYAFYNYKKLSSVVIPNSVTNIGDNTFDNCFNLSDIEISKNIVEIGSHAFYGTDWLKNQPDGEVYIGKVLYEYKGTMLENYSINIKEETTSIANDAFSGCKNLSSIEIPNSVTTIGESAFSGCTNLSTFSMSKNVATIGEGAFEDCTNLASIVIWQSVSKLGNRTFQGWKDTQTINIEANQIPNGWAPEWNNKCNAKIVYAYTGE